MEMRSGAKLPFDPAELDRLMDESGMDILFATSKHNVQYLLGGYRAQFFDLMDAIGVSRYLPLLVYPKGRPDKAAYFGHRFEIHQTQVDPLWVPRITTRSWGSCDAVEAGLAYCKAERLAHRRIGVEAAFLPMDTADLLRRSEGDGALVDALFVLERLRARKRPDEIACMRIASDAVVDSMLAVIDGSGPGTTKRELVEALKREETNRGLTFEYCLLTVGSSLNRAPSDDPWREGEILSLDSGGNYRGYIGDLARMAILGEPDAELQDLLAEITSVQDAALAAIAAGQAGRTIFTAAQEALSRSPNRAQIDFMAHGVGLVTHEAPRLTDKGPVPYPGTDGERPLEAGMVVSVETTLKHPRRGYIKLEDSAAVLADGCEVFADRALGWNSPGRTRRQSGRTTDDHQRIREGG